jgi:hypothetical protein
MYYINNIIQGLITSLLGDLYIQITIILKSINSVADISNSLSLPKFFKKITSLTFIALETNIHEPPCLLFFLQKLSANL